MDHGEREQYGARAYGGVVTDLRTTQLGVEVWEIGTPAIRATQIGVEVFYSMIPALVATQIGTEVWIDHSAGYISPATGAAARMLFG